MIRLDHIAIWTDQRDGLLSGVAEAAQLKIMDGYAPGGTLAARGVRFRSLMSTRSGRRLRATDRFTGCSG